MGDAMGRPGGNLSYGIWFPIGIAGRKGKRREMKRKRKSLLKSDFAFQSTAS